MAHPATGETFVDHVSREGYTDLSLSRYKEVASALTDLTIARDLLVSGMIPHDLVAGKSFPRRSWRKYNCDFSRDFIVVRRVINNRFVAATSPTLDEAPTHDDLKEEHYEVLANARGFALRRLQNGNEAFDPFSPQELVTYPNSYIAAHSALTNTATALVNYCRDASVANPY